MTHREDVSRREALRRLTAATVVPMAAGIGPLIRHPLVPTRGQEPWRSLVLDAHQTDTVAALAEAIIPETDTPGARAALVHQFIDFDLSEGSESERASFIDGLGWLDQMSRNQYGGNFIDVEVAQQNELLTAMASADSSEVSRTFFEDVKRRTVTGYYTSRMGMLEELQYRGNAFLTRFDGCTHPQHLDWEPRPER